MEYIREIIVTSMSEMCAWLRKDHIRIVELKPIKGIYKEDIIKIRYYHLKEEV